MKATVISSIFLLLWWKQTNSAWKAIAANWSQISYGNSRCVESISNKVSILYCNSEIFISIENLNVSFCRQKLSTTGCCSKVHHETVSFRKSKIQFVDDKKILKHQLMITSKFFKNKQIPGYFNGFNVKARGTWHFFSWSWKKGQNCIGKCQMEGKKWALFESESHRSQNGAFDRVVKKRTASKIWSIRTQ